jgi:kumamolisin
MNRLPIAAALAAAGMWLPSLPADAAGVPAAVARSVVAAPLARPDLVDLGRAPAATPVRLALTLRYRNQAELDRLVFLQATPGSPLYHHFLTVEQFAAYFAPEPAAYERVADSLRAAGFTVAPARADRTIVDAVGSASAAERYFGTRFHLVRQAGHGVRYANVTAATLPAGFASIVATVAGLDDVVKRHSDAVPAAVRPQPDSAASDAASRLASQGAPIERNEGGGSVGLYPAAFANAYRYPALAGYTGKGHGIAIVMDSNISNADLETYWKAAGVTRTGAFVRVSVDGADPHENYDVGETAIDTEITSSLAPAANIYLYLVDSLDDAPIEDAYDQTLSDRDHEVIDVVNSSFGGCELDDTDFAQATNAIAEQGAAEGLTFAASSGDAGGYCEDTNSKGGTFYEPDIVNNPASNPYFIAVGATTLLVHPSTGARASETAWSPGGPSGGSGGGVSSYFARPVYQNGVEGMAVVPTVKVTPPATQPKSGYAGRNVPDISLDGSNGNYSYLAVYADAQWTGYGGTSVASPAFAALLTEQNQLRKSQAGWYNPKLYATFTNSGKAPGGVYDTEFYDITSGGTGAGWSAHNGYDQATGIGSIDDGSM